MARRRKDNKKRARKYQEPVPGGWDGDTSEWSGYQVAVACGVVLAALVTGFLAWQELYTAGFAGAGIFVIVMIAIKLCDRHLAKEEEDDFD